MVECKNIVRRKFFNDKMPQMSVTADLFKDKYYKKNFNTCARFIVGKTLGKLHLPDDLFPN